MKRPRFGLGQFRQRGIGKGKRSTTTVTPRDFECCTRCGAQPWRHNLQKHNGTLALAHDFVPPEGKL